MIEGIRLHALAMPFFQTYCNAARELATTLILCRQGKKTIQTLICIILAWYQADTTSTNYQYSNVCSARRILKFVFSGVLENLFSLYFIVKGRVLCTAHWLCITHVIYISAVIWKEVRVTPASTLFMPRPDTAY